MATKKKTTETAPANPPDSLTQDDLTSGNSFLQPGINFDDAEGELFAGLNILRLKEGQAAGPFTVKEILKDQRPGTNKKWEPVDIYVALQGKVEVRMPISAAFVSKAKAAGLKEGDEFMVKRVADYDAKKHGKKGCADYLLKILRRA
jgi:hypothetical protein